jgi:hypothetical protein
MTPSVCARVNAAGSPVAALADRAGLYVAAADCTRSGATFATGRAPLSPPDTSTSVDPVRVPEAWRAVAASPRGGEERLSSVPMRTLPAGDVSHAAHWS